PRRGRDDPIVKVRGGGGAAFTIPHDDDRAPRDAPGRMGASVVRAIVGRVPGRVPGGGGADGVPAADARRRRSAAARDAAREGAVRDLVRAVASPRHDADPGPGGARALGRWT